MLAKQKTKHMIQLLRALIIGVLCGGFADLLILVQKELDLIIEHKVGPKFTFESTALLILFPIFVAYYSHLQKPSKCLDSGNETIYFTSQKGRTTYHFFSAMGNLNVVETNKTKRP